MILVLESPEMSMPIVCSVFFAINLFNKFVFITIWLWLIMLFFANLFTLIYWIIMFIPRYRRIFLKKYIKHGLSMSFLEKMPTDLYLFILFINSHDGSISNYNLCLFLYDNLYEPNSLNNLYELN